MNLPDKIEKDWLKYSTVILHDLCVYFVQVYFLVSVIIKALYRLLTTEVSTLLDEFHVGKFGGILGEEEGAALGRLEVLLDELAGVGAGADVPLVEDALLEAPLRALADAGAHYGNLAILHRQGNTVCP